MSLASTIERLATDRGITVTRTTIGTLANGIYSEGMTSTLNVDLVVEPAYNLNRVIGGANMIGRVDGEYTTDVRQAWCTTELFTRSATNEPDVVGPLQGHMWTVARVERWDLRGQVHFHVVLTAVTDGAAPQ